MSMDNEDLRTLALFEKVEKNQGINQRQLAKELGISLGLTNAFIQKVLQKGWMRARQVSARRWIYFLTPQGGMEKSRLTANYLKRSIDYFRDLKQRVNNKLMELAAQGIKGLHVYGRSDLSEVVTLCLPLWEIELLSTITTDHLTSPDSPDMPLLPELHANQLILITALEDVEMIKTHLLSNDYKETEHWVYF
ncbi:MAG: winged helix-turn-helix transcriptional regulator [SAR324 cluster bacterium]|nr:winged helix-turn-helix transcriptional regulator [SAR324 cluster bacterium]